MIRHTKEIKNRKTEVQVFETLTELNELLQHSAQTKPRVRNRLVPTGRYDFIGREFNSVIEWKEAMDEVYKEGISTIEDMVTRLEDQVPERPKNRRRRRTYDEYDGDEVDYDKLREGAPYWQTCKREMSIGPANFTLVVDASTNCSLSPRDILWKGAAGITVTNILEKAGFRTELWLIEYAKEVYTDGTDNMAAICLKRSSEPLNISTIATAVAGWYYRTALFALMEDSIDGRKATSHLGFPNYSLDKEHVQEFTSDPNYTILKAESEWDAMAAARKTLARVTELQKGMRR